MNAICYAINAMAFMFLPSYLNIPCLLDSCSYPVCL